MKPAAETTEDAAEFAAGKTGNRERALEFDRIASEIFAPIYPLIAARLLEPGVGGKDLHRDKGRPFR